MGSLILKAAPHAMAVVCSDDELQILLTDGRWLSGPNCQAPMLTLTSVT